MTFKVLTEVVQEKLASIAPVLAGIEQGNDGVNLRDLKRLLIEAMRLFQRNPGIEAAADDLYAAASALIADRVVMAQPIARKQRLLKEAHLRFRTRLESAVDRLGPYDRLAVPELLSRHAA